MTTPNPIPDWCEICERDPVDSGPVAVYRAYEDTTEGPLNYPIRLCASCAEMPPDSVTLSPWQQ